MKLLNKSCKFCRNNCFGAINLSVNYSVMGQLLRIALRAKAWHVRKPHWNALLSAHGMTTVCNVTAVYTDWIIRHILPRRTGHWVCRAYTVAEQHLLIRWAAEGSLSIHCPCTGSESFSVHPATSRWYQCDVWHERCRHADMPTKTVTSSSGISRTFLKSHLNKKTWICI